MWVIHYNKYVKVRIMENLRIMYSHIFSTHMILYSLGGVSWVLKAMLRWFELAYGLRVNFSKSFFMVVNAKESFLSVATGFLNCKLGEAPSKCYGVLMDANFQNASNRLLDIIRCKLGLLSNRY